MKILCVADHVDPLVYSSAVKTRFTDARFVLSAGDLPMEYLGFLSASLNKRIFFVFGNHHLKHLTRFRRPRAVETDVFAEYQKDSRFKNYFGSTYVGGKVVRHEGVLIAGLGGCRRYNQGENQFTDTQMFLKVFSLIPRLLWNRVRYGRYLDILLTHAPPVGINDRPDPTHTGFKAFIWFMEHFRPTFLLHGHVHLYDINAQRATSYKETTVINVYDHYVLDFRVDER
jgi:Icc-related predicted phosphoesterase